MTKHNDSLYSATFALVPASDIEVDNADVQIRFTHPQWSPYSDIFIIDSSSGTAIALQRHVPGVRTISDRTGFCLLTTSLRNVDEILYGEARSLFLASAQIREPSVRLLNYTENYHFIAIPPTLVAWTFAYRHDRLWVGVQPFDAGPYQGDSILLLSTTGETIRILPAPRAGIINMTWVEGDLWGMYDSQPVKFIRCDSNLSVTGEFTLEGYRDRVHPGMTWAANRLWVVDRYESRILGIDLDSSLHTGSAVIPDTITSSQNLYPSRGLAWDGEHICLASQQGRFLRFNLHGDTAASLALPARVESMAWDGEAMWIMHQGAGEATTDATLLSRFYPR